MRKMETREIKFRAWDVNKSRFISDYDEVYINTEGKAFTLKTTNYNGDYLSGENVIIQLYTGLKDKNGKEIYEGDVLKYTAHDGYGMFPGRLTVKWINKSACFGYSHSDQSFTPGYVSPFTEHDELQYDVLNHCEIIGNIYENPELLTANNPSE